MEQIKPNELRAEDVRVGNYLKGHLTGQPVKVDWLVIKHLWDGNIQSVYAFDVPAYEPIPLTEEVLRAAGFELQKDRDMYWISLNNYSIILHIEKGGRFSYFINSIQIMYVDTLHQLQNLVHALTGSELEVSLPLIGNSPIME